MFNSCSDYQNNFSFGCSNQNTKPNCNCGCNQNNDKFNNCKIVKICTNGCQNIY